MTLTFAKELYPKCVLLKAAYNFTDRAYIHLDANETHYIVLLRPKTDDAVISTEEFVNEMLCQSVRHTVYLQTKSIRELLVARAVSSTVIAQPEALDVSSECAAENYDINEIMEDWFKKYDDTQA